MTLNLPPHLRVFVCKHIFEKQRPVLLVSNTDGDFCFLCGSEHLDNEDEYFAVGLKHVLQADPSLEEALEDLPENWEAERSAVGLPWQLAKILPQS